MQHYKRIAGLYLIGFGLALSCFDSVAQDITPRSDTVIVSLQSAMNRALETSPEIQAVAARRAFADARFTYAKAFRYLSEFKATSAHSTAPGLKNIEGIPTDQLYLDPAVRNDWSNISPFSRIDVALAQPIFTWGELSGSIKAAEYGVAVEEASVDAKELDVALRTGQLYYGMLLAEALSRLASEANSIVARAITEIDSQLDAGATEVDYADLFQVQIAEQEVRRRVVEVEQRLYTLRSALARQMMLPIGMVPDAGDRILEQASFTLGELAVYQESALGNRPEIAQADAGLAARQALVGVARSDYYPKLFAAANAKYSFVSNRYRQRNPYIGDPLLSRGVEAGIGFRQNLNFSQTAARVEQARSEAAEVQFQGEAAHLLALYEVEEAFRNVIVARSAVETGDEALLISRTWLQDEQINFDLDLADAENLVRAVQSNLELQAAQYQAVYDFNVAVLKLLKSTGTLTQTVRSGMLVE